MQESGNILEELSGSRISVSFEVIKKTDSKPKTEKNNSPDLKKDTLNQITEKIKVKSHPDLREDYTFENFIIGENNSFAANAALAIANNPGRAYNPFLIYGGVGLGKTQPSPGHRAFYIQKR